jgi:hypothetical protein
VIAGIVSLMQTMYDFSPAQAAMHFTFSDTYSSQFMLAFEAAKSHTKEKIHTP